MTIRLDTKSESEIIREEHVIPVGRHNLAATLYIPGGNIERNPCIVMAHGFALIKQARLETYALRFCEAGFVVVLFDYRHFGNSGGDPRALVNISKQRKDWHAALVYAHRLACVDKLRVVAWGTSFSGGHVIDVVADYPELARVVIAQVPFMDGLICMKATGIRNIFALASEGIKDIWSIMTRQGRWRVRVAGPPNTLAIMATDDAEEGYQALVSGLEWIDSIPALAVFSISFYSPLRKAARINCPVLFCVAEFDKITPPTGPIRAAKKMKDATVLTYPVGHFDVYWGEMFEKAISDQIEFLKRAL